MFRMRSPLSALVVSAGLLCAVMPARAQTPTSRLSGTVRTSSGTPLAGARVIATSRSGVARTASADASGHYVIGNLQSGDYTVAATLVGYRRVTRENVRLEANGSADFALEPVPLNAITVTATLREQELKDVPFSIAAPTAAQLRSQGADNIEDVAITQAGFSVQNLGPGQSQVAMRGTSSGQTARDQPGVKEEVGV